MAVHGKVRRVEARDQGMEMPEATSDKRKPRAQNQGAAERKNWPQTPLLTTPVYACRPEGTDPQRGVREAAHTPERSIL